MKKDPTVAAGLEQVVREGRRVPLRDVVGGDWDRVFVLPGENPEEWVEEKVGGPLDMPDIHNFGNEHGGILVFKRGTQISKAVAFETFPLRSDGGAFSADVLVGPDLIQPEVLVLREPNI